MLASACSTWWSSMLHASFSVQLSHSVVSDSWQPHGLQHARLPCPPPTPRAYSNSCPYHRWCHPTISSSVVCFSFHLQSFPPSIRVFSSGSVFCITWPKNWSFSFNISPSNEDSGPISFRMNWLDLLAVQGTLKSLLQNNSSKSLLGKLNLSKYVHKAGSTDNCLTYIDLKPFESWKSYFPRYSDMES